jgi:histidinol-phosphate aminotransferase
LQCLAFCSFETSKKQAMSLENLVRPNIWKLKPYSSARSEFKGDADIFLDANENPFETEVNRYPDPLQWALKKRLSGLKGVPPRQIFLGNGSDEVIDLLIRIFCEPRVDHILQLPPTYGMYQVSASIADVGVKEVSLTADFQPNVEGILGTANEHSKLLFLCSPNNPTGNSMDRDRMIRLLEAFPGIVVVDEAYIDFSESPSMIEYLPQYPRLVVMQTFSKAWGMAGIRLGMAFAAPAIIELFNKVKPPYNINQLTQNAALAALADPGRKQREVAILLAEREKLTGMLEKLDFVQRIHPTAANFLLIQVPDPNGLYQFLVGEKIIVRNRSNVHLCEGGIRISVGRPEENEILIQLLHQYTAQ